MTVQHLNPKEMHANPAFSQGIILPAAALSSLGFDVAIVRAATEQESAVKAVLLVGRWLAADQPKAA